MAKIGTLVQDVYELVDQGKEVSEEDIARFSSSLAQIMSDRLNEDRSGASYLRPSNIGEKCDRKTWLSVHRPELAEKLSPDTKLKFLIGDMWEQILLFLAEQAGHTVEGQQDRMEINGVVGSRDAVIDGVTTDVKSASTYSFQKFDKHLEITEDAFGYLKQIGFYLEAGKDDPVVTDKEHAAFFVGDKTLGKIALDIHKKGKTDYAELIEKKRKMLSSDKMPPRAYFDEPDGKSGNRKLGVACSYCPFKRTCWPGLRTFAYSTGPRFLTEVKRVPDVHEIT